MGFIAPAEGARVLMDLLAWPVSEVAVLPARWDAYAAGVPEGARRLLTELVTGPPSQPGAASGSESTSLARSLEGVPAGRRRPLLIKHLHELAARALGLDQANEIASERPLKELGLDSLMAVELRNTVGAAVGRALPATLMLDYPTLDSLADFLLTLLAPEADKAAAGQPKVESVATKEVVGLSEAEAEMLLLKELEAASPEERGE
jgi:polyketide synthase 12/myxalamid-type polyketide synthase MxaB